MLRKSCSLSLDNNDTATPINACAHLHGVDGSLCSGSSQRSSNEPLMRLDLPWFTGQQLLILNKHNKTQEAGKSSNLSYNTQT